MRRNYRPAPCCVCHAPVAAQAGYLYGPPWTVKCELCSGVVVPTTDIVKITRLNGHVAIEPANHLGGDKFAAYRAAIEGAKYNGAAKRNEAPVALVPVIAARLKAAPNRVHAVVEPSSNYYREYLSPSLDRVLEAAHDAPLGALVLRDDDAWDDRGVLLAERSPAGWVLR